MNLTDLFDKRLIIVSGKGGVGKTTCALSLALTAQKLGKKVLIVEFGSTERVAPYFDLTKIGHKEVKLDENLYGLNLDPKKCFEEYVIKQVRFKAIYNTLINNRFVAAFLEAVPGLNELLMVGKIFELEREKKSKVSRKYRYDLIVVDGPATGHGVSAFDVPQVVHDAVSVGPLRKQSDKMLKLLRDEKKTAFCVVSLPEEMPAVESLELIASVKNKLKINLGPLFLNRFHESPITKSVQSKLKKFLRDQNHDLFPYAAYANLSFERSTLHVYYKDFLRKKLGDMVMVEMPQFFEELLLKKDLEPLVNSFANQV